MKLILFTSLLICHCLVYVSEATDRHMLCKDVEEIFNAQNTGARYPTRIRSGPRGKEGPVGLPGAKGDQGEPGEVDYAALNKTINELVKAAVAKEFKRINKTMFNESRQQQEVEEQPQVCTQDDVITYQNKCFWLVLRKYHNMNFAVAQETCSQRGGRPADILSGEHYKLVEQKFKEISTTTKWFWTGMMMNMSTEEVNITSGATAPYLKWYPGWPSSKLSYTGINIQFNIPPASDGMFNRDPTRGSSGVLCQA